MMFLRYIFFCFVFSGAMKDSMHYFIYAVSIFTLPSFSGSPVQIQDPILRFAVKFPSYTLFSSFGLFWYALSFCMILCVILRCCIIKNCPKCYGKLSFFPLLSCTLTDLGSCVALHSAPMRLVSRKLYLILPLSKNGVTKLKRSSLHMATKITLVPYPG